MSLSSDAARAFGRINGSLMSAVTRGVDLHFGTVQSFSAQRPRSRAAILSMGISIRWRSSRGDPGRCSSKISKTATIDFPIQPKVSLNTLIAMLDRNDEVTHLRRQL